MKSASATGPKGYIPPVGHGSYSPHVAHAYAKKKKSSGLQSSKVHTVVTIFSQFGIRCPLLKWL